MTAMSIVPQEPGRDQGSRFLPANPFVAWGPSVGGCSKTPLEARLAELRQWEREEGRGLPLLPAHIIRLEDQGWIVDLVTGEIVGRADDAPFVPTEAAEALVAALRAEEVEEEGEVEP